MSAAIAAAAAAALNQRRYGSDSSRHGSADQTLNVFDYTINANPMEFFPQMMQPLVPSRYETQKRRDWASFSRYLRDHRPPLALSRCSGAHVIEFLKFLDQFGKTKVHTEACPFFGMPCPPAACPCPLRQAWGSLDALVGRLRAAFEENGGCPEANPFAARPVRLYLREVRNAQAKDRGITYEKKKRRNPSAKATQRNYQDAEEHDDGHPTRYN